LKTCENMYNLYTFLYDFLMSLMSLI